MGVMSCYRKDCPNVMCDTYVGGVGYVCNECKEEFKQFLASKGSNADNEARMKIDLTEFMRTPKGLFKESATMDVDEFFRSYTRD